VQVIDAANDVIESIDREELAKFFALKNDPEDDDAEVLILVPVHYFVFLLNVTATYISNKFECSYIFLSEYYLNKLIYTF
jgi:predicted ATP-grasp superfamily ATP-dependent carboligase